jgi:hypothetical protein
VFLAGCRGQDPNNLSGKNRQKKSEKAQNMGYLSEKYQVLGTDTGEKSVFCVTQPGFETPAAFTPTTLHIQRYFEIFAPN